MQGIRFICCWWETVDTVKEDGLRFAKQGLGIKVDLFVNVTRNAWDDIDNVIIFCYNFQYSYTENIIF